jgi:hypothetical protein
MLYIFPSLWYIYMYLYEVVRIFINNVKFDVLQADKNGWYVTSLVIHALSEQCNMQLS